MACDGRLHGIRDFGNLLLAVVKFVYQLVQQAVHPFRI